MICTSNTMTFTIEGDVNVGITITEVDGALQFEVIVLDDTGSIGDLNALFFDLKNDDLTEGLIITGDDVTGTNLKVDGVTKVDSYTNMNGEVIKDLGKFDGGVQFGTSGMANDDIQSTSFTIAHPDADLSLADFALQDFGIRLTSVGEVDGDRSDSLKLGGTAPEAPEGGTNTAVDDLMTVTEDAIFGRGDTFDFLDSGADSVLANDIACDGSGYAGTVSTVNETATDTMQFIEVQGTNGGTLQITADGAINFSAVNDQGINTFEGLNDGESESTFFDYTLESGETARLEVVVNGIGDGGGGGGGGDFDMI